MSDTGEFELQSDDLQPKADAFDRDRYVRALTNGEFTNLGAFEFSPRAAKQLRDIVLSMLARQSREDLLDTIYPLTKELIVNAAKANLKFALKRQNDSASTTDLKEALTGRTDAFRRLALTAREMGLWVRIKSFVDTDGAYFLVKNNVPISPEDDVRVRQKLAAAMKCENLAEYFLAQTGEQEGAGIGFAMIITSLKGLGLDGKYLTIGVEGDCTVSRLHLPFSAFARA